MTSKIYTPTERQVWLHSINRIIQTIRITFDILTEGNEKEPKSKTSRRYIVIIGYLIIQLKTFIDEWDLAVDDAEIIAFKKQFAPIVKAIRSYKDISYIRNSLLAHSRDKSNNNGSLLLSDNLASYSVPIHLLDMLYVNSLLDFLQKAIQHEFNADFAHGKLETQHLKSQKTVVSNFKGLDEMKVKIEDTIKLCNVL